MAVSPGNTLRGVKPALNAGVWVCILLISSVSQPEFISIKGNSVVEVAI